MAKRSGPPDIKSQLGSLFTAAMQQLDQVREVVQQRTRAGRVQFDLVLLRRKRRDALAQLGEQVVKLAQAGRIDEEELPELSASLSRIEALDEQIEREEQNVGSGGGAREEDDADYDAADEDGDGHADGEFDEEAHTRVRSRDPRAARAAAGADEDDDEDDDYPPPDDEDEADDPPPDDEDDDDKDDRRR